MWICTQHTHHRVVNHSTGTYREGIAWSKSDIDLMILPMTCPSYVPRGGGFPGILLSQMTSLATHGFVYLFLFSFSLLIGYFGPKPHPSHGFRDSTCQVDPALFLHLSLDHQHLLTLHTYNSKLQPPMWQNTHHVHQHREILRSSMTHMTLIMALTVDILLSSLHFHILLLVDYILGL